ncbi:MAG: choice-of-anchor J domain-containing protein [Bacteroidetes bacterium]|nr:choice-of-anchor J domain-containing protein [Bacteroidota bacterium]
MKKILLMALFAAGTLGLAQAQTNILTEDFEGGAVPAGWSNITLATDGGWKVGNNNTLQSQSFPIAAHTLMAATNDDGCNCNKSNDVFLTPVMNLTTFTTVFMSYDCYYFNLAYQGLVEEAKIVATLDNGVTFTDLQVVTANSGTGWQTNLVDLSSVAGNANVQIGFKYNDKGGWLYGWAIDDVAIYEPLVGVDLAVSNTIVGKDDARPVFTAYPKYLTNLPLSVQTTLTNAGTIPITSFDFSWTDGVNTYNQSLTSLSIAPLSNYTLTATVPYNTLSGLQTITTSITNINNGAVELSTANNSTTYNVEGITPHPDKKYFAEEGTGTWCQWCPRGAVFMDYMTETYPSQFVGVAVHNADPMTLTAYDAGIGALIGGYPSVVPNRGTEIDPSELEGNFMNSIVLAPEVVISGISTISLANNQITVDLTGTFNQSLNGDYRFLAIVAEDSVSGTTGYSQSNSYGGGANGPMGGFENFGTTVPAASMNYNFVGRALLNTFGGQSGSLPAAITSGSSYNYQFTTIANAAWDKSQLWIAAVVINNSTGAVLNTNKFPVVITTGLNNQNNPLVGSYVYPTATSDIINLALHLQETSSVMVTVTDVLGKVIMNQDLGQISKGESKMFWNVGNLSAGMYHMTLTTPSGKTALKFIKE